MRTGTEKVKQNTEIEVMMGRKVKIPVASGVAARFDFEELCGKALGAADYLAIVRSYHVIFIDRWVWMRTRPRNRDFYITSTPVEDSFHVLNVHFLSNQAFESLGWNMCCKDLLRADMPFRKHLITTQVP